MLKCPSFFKSKTKTYNVDEERFKLLGDEGDTRTNTRYDQSRENKNNAVSVQPSIITKNSQQGDESEHTDVKHFKDRIEELEAEITALHGNVDQLHQQLTLKKLENEELLIRLSKMASAKLTDNNPNIADLNDLNRPTKIAERFSELYDNEWTNAFDDLNEKNEKSDMQSINMLLKIEIEIYEKCQTRAASDLKQLKETIENFINVEQLPDSMSSSLKAYKDERKKNFKRFLPSFEQEMEQATECITGLKYDQVPYVKTYVELSTELCWLMAIQDPPVTMLTKCEAGVIFNGNVYKTYTCNGKLVEYLVWPALYLHDDGPLLCKGVAQCVKDNLGPELQDSEDNSMGDDNSLHIKEGHFDSDLLDGLSADSDSKQQQSVDCIEATDKCQHVDNEDNLPDQTQADSLGEVSPEHTNADEEHLSTKM